MEGFRMTSKVQFLQLDYKMWSTRVRRCRNVKNNSENCNIIDSMRSSQQQSRQSSDTSFFC